jgi:hypothetical protein
MGRPHIEMVVDTDVALKPFGLPGWKRGIQVRTLSIDPVNGACTQIAEIGGGFRQPAGFSTSEWELYVLDGSLTVGDAVLRPHHYLFVPAGYRLEAISSREGCKVMWFFNDHFPDWVTAEAHRDGSVATQGLVSTNANDAVRWTTPTFYPQTEPGIFVKLLRFDEATGAFTGLYNMCAGFWQDNISFHDCMEEMYHLWGESWMMQFGYVPTGGYIYRPPYINHGPFQCEYGTLGLFRTDSWLVNHFNWNPWRTPDECRLSVVEKMRLRQPDLMNWVFMHADEFVP